MIHPVEIEAKSKEFEINPANIQRDYIFGWLIHGIFTISGLKDYIFLKGGNALRKGYFGNTRYSNDLDFGLPGDISEHELIKELNSVCDFIHQKTQVDFLTDDTKVKEKFIASETPIPNLKVYEARVYFKDFNGAASHLKIKIAMDLTRFDRVFLPLQMVTLIHPYSDADEIGCTIRCMKLEEIIATKLKCLVQRQHAPDLFDYAYSIKVLGGNLNKSEVVDTLIRKTIFKRNPQTLKEILVNTSFDYFRAFWLKTLICAKQAFIDVEIAIETFLADLNTLFNGYLNNGYSQFIYFPVELRTPIMEAGREQTLLKICYKGSIRMVEPYSLKYLEKRNGEEKEYLYVYNLSGGSSSEPGIRCMLPQGFQSIENTEEKYEPRFQIELSKAGDIPENRYLFDPNKPLRPKKARGIRVKNSQLKFEYKCAFCGKKFTKLKQDSKLRSHKNKRGYLCTGTFGYYTGSRY